MLVIMMMPCCTMVSIVSNSDAVSALARRLANSIVPWGDIRALVSNHLIASDKCPGVPPIGIGESLRRIVGKAIFSATLLDLAALCGID